MSSRVVAGVPSGNKKPSVFHGLVLSGAGHKLQYPVRVEQVSGNLGNRCFHLILSGFPIGLRSCIPSRPPFQPRGPELLKKGFRNPSRLRAQLGHGDGLPKCSAQQWAKSKEQAGPFAVT